MPGARIVSRLGGRVVSAPPARRSERGRVDLAFIVNRRPLRPAFWTARHLLVAGARHTHASGGKDD